jgi:glycosyltransferase involved in cell wall biosynthesis
VVYPPVDTDFFHPDSAVPERRVLMVSALVPYKRLDVAIEACRRARVPLTIVGTGPDRARLEQRAAAARVAGVDVEFLGRQSDELIRDLYRRCAVTLMTGEEDFGIVPVEAQACGRAVVALGRGGARETVVPGETGILVDEPTADAFADAVSRALDQRFDAAAIRRNAERFSRARFRDAITQVVANTVDAAHAGETIVPR